MAKKDFKRENPALSFISIPEEEQEQEVKDLESRPAPEQLQRKPQAPQGYKLNPAFIELKSKRVQLLLQPSVVQAIKDKAKEKGLSMNEAINEAIVEYLERN